jgi:4-hydroxybenzoate polyprenyltransferase
LNTIRREHIELKRELEKAFVAGRKVVSFLVSSSLFVALALFSVIYFSFLALNISPDFPMFFAAFLVTFSLYNLNKITDKEEDTFNNPDRLTFITNRTHILLTFSVISYIIALFIGVTSGEIVAIIVLLLPLWVAILYSVRIAPGFRRLKDIYIAKSLSVTIGLVFSTSLLAYIYFQNIYIIFFWVFFLFVKLFINTVLFDVRDIAGDRKLNINTIPAVLGFKKTKYLLIFLNSFLIPWVAVTLYLNFFVALLPVIVFSVFYGYWCIFHFCNSKKKSSLSYDLLVDGEWMVLVIMLVFLQRFFYV